MRYCLDSLGLHVRASAVLRSVICRTLAVALAAFAVLSAVIPAPAFAAESDQQVKTARVGWLVNNEGFQDGTPGERLSGWGYEYLQTLSYYTPGWRYEYVSGTFTELMDMLEAGEIDLMPNTPTPRNAPKSCSFPRTPRAPSATTSTPGPTVTTSQRVTLKHSKVSLSATTLALYKPSLASSGSPTRESPAHTGSMTEDPISLTRSQTTKSMPSS